MQRAYADHDARGTRDLCSTGTCELRSPYVDHEACSSAYADHDVHGRLAALLV